MGGNVGDWRGKPIDTTPAWTGWKPDLSGMLKNNWIANFTAGDPAVNIKKQAGGAVNPSDVTWMGTC